MKSLSPKEVEHLSDMLMSEDENNVVLGFQLLANNQHHIKDLVDELILIYVFNQNASFKTTAHQQLSTELSERQIGLRTDDFVIFQNYQDIGYQEKRPINQLKKFELVRPQYQALINKNLSYLNNYADIARQIRWYRKSNSYLTKIAINYYKIIHQVNPLDEKNLFNLANLLADGLKKHKEALRYYLKLVELNAQHSDAIHNIGHLYHYEFEEYDKAFEYYDRSLKIAPNDPLFIENMALLCMYDMEGDEYKELAKVCLLELIDKDPSSADHWDNWGYYCWMIEKDYEATREAYSNGLKYNPNNASLLGNMAELHSDIFKDYEKAMEYYIKSYKAQPRAYYLVNMIALYINAFHDFKSAKKYYLALLKITYSKTLESPYSLFDHEWERFLKAEKELLEHFPELVDKKAEILSKNK